MIFALLYGKKITPRGAKSDLRIQESYSAFFNVIFYDFCKFGFSFVFFGMFLHHFGIGIGMFVLVTSWSWGIFGIDFPFFFDAQHYFSSGEKSRSENDRTFGKFPQSISFRLES